MRPYPPVERRRATPRRDPAAWEAARAYLRARGLDPELARDHGWYAAQCRDGLRLVIPTTVPGYWQARALAGQEPRYVSAAAERGPALVVVAPTTPIRLTCVVEGPLDALAAAMAGALGIATMGTAVSREALTALRARAVGRVVVVVDTDTAELARSVLHALPLARLVTVYPYKDLAAAPVEVRARLLGRWLDEDSASDPPPVG